MLLLKTLSFDFEGAKIPNHVPWKKDFYVTVGCFMPSWGPDPQLFWFDHSTKLPTPHSVESIQELVYEADIIAAHHIKYDLSILKHLHVDTSKSKLHCTMVAEYLLSGQNTVDHRFNLSAVSERRGLPPKIDIIKTRYWDRGIDTYDVPEVLLEEYVIDDTHKVHVIAPAQLKEIDEVKKVYDVQMDFTNVLCDIEVNGFKWDTEKSLGFIEDYHKKCEGLREDLGRFCEDPRLNLGSSKQLSAYLYGGQVKVSWYDWVITEYKTKPYSKYHEKKFEELINVEGVGFKPLPKTKMADERYYSTSKETIEKLKCTTKKQRAIKKLLLELSVHQKAAETFKGKKKTSGLVNKVSHDGNIHPKLNQSVTKTGRQSSSDPNSQNLPRKGTSPIKKCVVPRNDGIMQYDLSQIEWRAAAWLSQDVVMINEINSGIDQHNAACVDLMEMELTKDNRTDAKIFNFRMIYGGTPFGFYMDNKMPNFSKKKWFGIVDAFCNKYYGLTDWQNINIEHVYNNNGWLQIPTGRKFKFPLEMQRDGSQGYNDRKIKNYPVQGISGGDILPLCGSLIRRGMIKNKLKSKIILTVHDSIVFDYIEEEKERLARMCMIIGRSLPKYISEYFGVDWNVKLDGEVEVGPSYGELEEYEVKY